MNEDLKFPVKYAVLELKSNGGYSTNYEDVTEGFIVSKCYVVGSEVRYFPTGEAKVTYKVYFPYDDIENFFIIYSHNNLNNGRYVQDRKMFGIDACNNYYPVHIVEGIFDTYEGAKEEAEQKNENMRRKISLAFSISDSSFKEKYDKAVEEFKKRLSICSFYEQFIADNTEDMKVTKDERLDALQRLRKR